MPLATRVVLWGLCCALAVSCASSRRGSACDDPNATNCVPIDVDAAVPYDAPPDGRPGKLFGEPCNANDQCESHLCILVGTTGQCTQRCGECPATYGCLGVTGIEIDGQVTFVCVPTSDQLCTTCTQDSECTLIGMDRCVTYPDGDRACARDCTDVSCPTGYDCETVAIGGVNYQQCMAASGACDCTEANPGAEQTCNIPTPWNVCQGTQTCGGASGWGGCEPPSPTDDPDATYVDSNCDGLDGDIARAIFVSSAGVNAATCGLVYSDPCKTITYGIARAQQAARPHVYVQTGDYAESVTMVAGVSVFGGYNFNWRRQAYSAAGHTVTIHGGIPAVRFHAINAPTWLDNVVVRSANALGTGASSVGVLVTQSTQVELRSVLVQPGAGTAGLDGTGGIAGAGGLNGGQGNPGCEDSGIGCGDCARPAGGLPGGSFCGYDGGVGGLPGKGGGGGDWGDWGEIATPPGAGATCGGSRVCSGSAGSPGAPAGGADHGTGGGSIGAFSGTTYVASTGTPGTNGSPGNGGGGGGGGGGGDDSCDSYGSSGGGGGGGGCGGTRGTAGTGGGGSFGVLTVDSALQISGSIVTGGIGGAGGRGGSGGSGGLGGLGGPGGPYGGGGEQDDGGDGATGGSGGAGGRGGDGGGGGGGPSVAVVCLGTSGSATAIVGTTLTGGASGAGGSSLAPGASGISTTSYGCQ